MLNMQILTRDLNGSHFIDDDDIIHVHFGVSSIHNIILVNLLYTKTLPLS